MELTLASAFSSDSVMGHMAYVVLIASMLMRTLLWLRIFVIMSAFLGIAYASIILNDPVSTFWETCLVVVNIVQILRSHWRSLRAKFSTAEATMLARRMPGLSKGEARTLLDAGTWASLEKGAILTVQGERVDHLIYIAEGTAEVLHGGSVVAHCTPGTFVGEMTVVTGSPATATVRAPQQMIVWQIKAEALRSILGRADDTAREIEAAFARNYREKLVQMNELVASGAVPA